MMPILSVISSNLEINNFSRDYVNTLTLNNQGTGKTSSLTLVRPASALVTNPQGFLSHVQSGEPRFSYDSVTKKNLGLFFGQSKRANVLDYSEDFSQNYWIKSGLTFNLNTSFTSPSGNFSSYEFNEGTATGVHILSSTAALVTDTSINNVFYCSIYAKAGTCDTFQIRFDNPLPVFTAGRSAVVDLSRGVFAATNALTEASITPAGDGWYKIMITAPAALTGVATGVRFSLCTRATSGQGTPSYTGTNRNIYFWGAHYANSTSDFYTPTYGLSAAFQGTGNAWTNGFCDYPNFTIDSTICQNNSAGTFYIEWIPHGRQSGNLDTLYGFSSDSSSNLIGFYSPAPGNVQIGVRYRRNGTNLIPSGGSAVTNINGFQITKAAFAWEIGAQSFVANGNVIGNWNVATLITTNAGGVLRSGTIGQFFASNIKAGWYRKFNYYPYKIPDQVLIGMTR